MLKFSFRVERSDEQDVKIAIAAWQLAWASRVELGEIEEDGKTTILVVMSDDWQQGPAPMVAWAASKLTK